MDTETRFPSCHVIIAFFLWLTAVVILAYGAFKRKEWDRIWKIALAVLLGAPVLTEMLLTLKWLFCRCRIRNKNYVTKSEFDKKYPIVYSDFYNFDSMGLMEEDIDLERAKRVFEDLLRDQTIPSDAVIHKPELPPREILQSVMGIFNLWKLNYAFLASQVVNVKNVCFIPGWFIRWKALEPLQIQAKGSLDAACIAMHKGWAINLGGGFHYASYHHGAKFCIYPDITMITHFIEKWYSIERFLIIDLDANQGNGHEKDHKNKAKYYIIDCYNHSIYP